MNRFFASLLLVFSLFSVSVFGQQPTLKWNPSEKKLERLNNRMIRLNERLNKGNAALTRKLREAFPGRYDSLIHSLYNTEQPGAVDDVSAVRTEVSGLQESMSFARGQLGTNRVFKELGLAKGEIELLASQSAFLENLASSDLDLASLNLEDNVQQGQKNLEAYQQLLGDYEEALQDMSASLKEYVSEHPEVAAFKSRYEELKTIENSQPLLRTDTSGLQTKAVVKQAIGDHLGVEPSEVNELINNKIADANRSLDKLKKKYASVQGARNITRAERNPLAELPIKYRLVYQSNLSLNRGDLTSVDAQFSLGYRLNPKMTLGFGASQRTALGSDWDAINLKHLGWGYRVYYDYAFSRKFFIQAAFEKVGLKQATTDQDFGGLSQWKNGGLIGLGRNFSVGENTTASVIVMYNLINQNNSQFESPWVIRFGFNFNKKNQ